MITAIVADSPIASVGITEYRSRLATGERSLLPDSTLPVSRTPTASEDGRFPAARREAAPQPPEPDIDRSSMFAAAVIAGALSPTPQSMEELIMRIGSSPIPVESEARLKDLLA